MTENIIMTNEKANQHPALTILKNLIVKPYLLFEFFVRATIVLLILLRIVKLILIGILKLGPGIEDSGLDTLYW